MKLNVQGTEMYCPHCKTTSYCRRDDAFHRSVEYPYVSNQFLEDLNWYQRGRTCLTCEKSFVTVELEKDVIEELMSVRAKLQSLEESFQTQRLWRIALEKEGAVDSLENVIAFLKDFSDGHK